MPALEAIPHQPEADSFEFDGALQTIRQAIRGHRWIIAATVLLTCLLVGAYVWIWPPVYEAQVMVAVDSDKDIQRTAFYQGWNTFRKDGLNEEATLLTSAPVLKEVIRRLDLQYDDVYHPFTRYAIHLWAESSVGKQYRAFKRWLFGTRETAYAMSDEDIMRAKVLSDFSSGLSLRQVGEASIGVLNVKASTPRVAEIANTIVQVYLEQRRDRFVGEAQQAYDSLNLEAIKTKAELDTVAERLRKFRAESGTALLFEKDRGQIAQLLALRGAITDLQAVIAENGTAVALIDAQLAAEGEHLRSDRIFRDDAHKDRLPKLELALAAARRAYLPQSREVRELEEQIREAHAAIGEGGRGVVIRNSVRISDNYEVLRAKKHILETTLNGARAALRVREAELARLGQVLERVPQSLQTNHELELLQGTLETKFSGINSKLIVASVSLASARSAAPAMRIVEPASVPEQASAPQTKLLFLAAIVAGAFVGMMVALLMDVVHERASRNRLAGRDSRSPLLAVVRRDEEALRSLFVTPVAGGSRTPQLPGRAA